MTKRLILAALTALLAVAMATAQQISVVSEDGSTSVCRTLADAIGEASEGSVIYLPSGGFSISNDVRITKRITIIGNGYCYDKEKDQGSTIIAGNLYFDEGSDNSALLGCYVNNHVIVGYGNKSVNNITVRYCNIGAVEVHNASCKGVTINQNYIREGSGFGSSPTIFTHNICPCIDNLDGGRIDYNIFTSYGSNGGYKGALLKCDNDVIRNNIFIIKEYTNNDGRDNIVSGSMFNGTDWGENPVNIGEVDWNDVFVYYNNAAITPSSDFHFRENYQQYSAYGIYGGSAPFKDNPTTLTPRIVTKQVDEHTDVSGNLNIKIVVKTGE